jgi:hypothetical protein
VVTADLAPSFNHEVAKQDQPAASTIEVAAK